MKSKIKSLSLFVGIIMILQSFLPIMTLATDDIPDDPESAITVFDSENSTPIQISDPIYETPDEQEFGDHSENLDSISPIELKSDEIELDEKEMDDIIEPDDEEKNTAIEETEHDTNFNFAETVPELNEPLEKENQETDVNIPELDDVNDTNSENEINTPSYKGKITVKKNLLNNPDTARNDLSTPISFTFQLTGPNGYSNTFSLVPGETKEFYNLAFGDYSLLETENHGFNPYYSPDGG